MQVVHVQTSEPCNDYDVTFITMALRLTDGVKDVASVPSIGLTSVLYDESKVSSPHIVDAVRSAGFAAHEYELSDSAPPHIPELTGAFA